MTLLSSGLLGCDTNFGFARCCKVRAFEAVSDGGDIGRDEWGSRLGFGPESTGDICRLLQGYARVSNLSIC